MIGHWSSANSNRLRSLSYCSTSLEHINIKQVCNHLTFVKNSLDSQYVSPISYITNVFPRSTLDKLTYFLCSFVFSHWRKNDACVLPYLHHDERTIRRNMLRSNNANPTYNFFHILPSQSV